MKLKPFVFTLVILLSGQVLAKDITVSGTISHFVKKSDVKINSLGKPELQEIKLLKVHLSDKAQKVLVEKAKDLFSLKPKFSHDHSVKGKTYPSSKQLGMNEVPVLDQGAYGTCVTFATTATIDAVIGKKDYVSQLCPLQLGNYLENHAYTVSGWNGSFGRLALSQMEIFGIVSKTQESTKGCGGLTEYPSYDEVPDSSMSVEEYYQISEPLEKYQIEWSPILDVMQAVDRFDTEKTLKDVKYSIVQGDRVTFAVLLTDFDLGFMGAVGSKNAHYDSWVLTPEIARDLYLRPIFGGHEMIITGYDDQAVALDEEGREYRGLLTLRNSWGNKAGDNGDFYMSYEYFKLLVIEADRIHHNTDIV